MRRDAMDWYVEGVGPMRINTDTPVVVDPAALRAFVLSRPETRPGDVQREFRVGWNRACSLLEELEREGDLARLPGLTFVWTAAQGVGAPPPRGYALPLTSKEHGALLRLVEDGLRWKSQDGQPHPDTETLRAIRNRLKRPGGGS